MRGSEDRLLLLDQVATLYYERNLSQDEIASQVGISRSSISRLLEQARREGLVEIRVRHPLPRSHELENELVRRFGLLDARVLATRGLTYPETVQRLGGAGAQYLGGVLQKGQILALGWGNALAAVVSAFVGSAQLAIEVVQLIGGTGPANPDIDSTELARLLAQKVGGKYRYLNAPLLVESARVRTALLQEKTIAEALEMARRADLALVGIGSVDPRVCSIFHAGYIDRSELAHLHELGAVGDIFARHFDLNGRLVQVDLNNRVVGIDPTILREIPRRIGVAGGVEKGPAILGALRGRYLNILISDEHAVRSVLDLDTAHPVEAPVRSAPRPAVKKKH